MRALYQRPNPCPGAQHLLSGQKRRVKDLSGHPEDVVHLAGLRSDDIERPRVIHLGRAKVGEIPRRHREQKPSVRARGHDHHA